MVVGDSSRVEIDRIGLNIREGVGVAGVVVANQKQIGAELKRVIFPRPVQTVGELVDGHKSNGGASERNEVVDPIQKNSRIHGSTAVCSPWRMKPQ